MTTKIKNGTNSVFFIFTPKNHRHLADVCRYESEVYASLALPTKGNHQCRCPFRSKISICDKQKQTNAKRNQFDFFYFSFLSGKYFGKDFSLYLAIPYVKNKTLPSTIKNNNDRKTRIVLIANTYWIFFLLLPDRF